MVVNASAGIQAERRHLVTCDLLRKVNQQTDFLLRLCRMFSESFALKSNALHMKKINVLLAMEASSHQFWAGMLFSAMISTMDPCDQATKVEQIPSTEISHGKLKRGGMRVLNIHSVWIHAWLSLLNTPISGLKETFQIKTSSTCQQIISGDKLRHTIFGY